MFSRLTEFWKLGLLAFAAMFAQDLLYTCMVVMESNFHPVAAGLFDDVSWFAWLASSGIAVETVIKNGWRTKKSVTIIAAITLANFLGTVTGVGIAKVLSS